jgi:DNA polymerase
MSNHVDFETRSALDLSNVGIHLYATHESTKILCVAFSLDGGETVECWRQGDPPPLRLFEAVERGEVFWAHNAEFERHIWTEIAVKRLGWPPVKEWECTMVLCAYAGLPLGLDLAAHVARVDEQKDKKGRALMLKMTKDVKGEKDTPEKFDRLCEYCIQDVKTECKLHAAVSNMRSVQRVAKMEEPARLMDRDINDRGAPIDVPTARAITGMLSIGGTDFGAELREITGGALTSPGQVAKIKEWLHARGVFVADLRADTLPAFIRVSEDLVARRVMEIRLAASQTSTAKFARMLSGVSPDGRARGLFQFYGASQTGRYAGRRIQLQNLPKLKKTFKPWTDTAIDAFRSGDADMVRCIFGDILTGAKQLVRPCVASSDGLTVADASQIELRINAWLAGEKDLLRIFATGGDPYVKLACEIYGRKITKADNDERQVGKIGMLGCGYQMGAAKFKATLEKYDVQGTDAELLALSEKTVPAFRALYPKIKRLWWELGNAALTAFREGSRVDVGSLAFLRPSGTDMLLMRLPSSRLLHYWHVRVDQGDYGPGLSCEAVRNKKVVRSHLYGGKFLENACQAISRDLIIHAMLKLHGAGERLIGMVHDEIIGEGLRADAYREAMTKDQPAWAKGLPLDAEAAECFRYVK